MDRDSVRKMVQNYIDKNNLSNPEFARQAKINDRTVRFVVNITRTVLAGSIHRYALVTPYTQVEKLI
ncbi:hypothetical protein FAM18168_02910 [Lacticaseibacillus paracasei]|nr:hypothetical protein FAM18168_02910 [Lacticaseibacillus paracasei]